MNNPSGPNEQDNPAMDADYHEVFFVQGICTGCGLTLSEHVRDDDTDDERVAEKKANQPGDFEGPIEDIEYDFTITVGEDGAEVGCANYPGGSWEVSTGINEDMDNLPTWEAINTSLAASRTITGTVMAGVDPMTYGIARAVREILDDMRSGRVFG